MKIIDKQMENGCWKMVNGNRNLPRHGGAEIKKLRPIISSFVFIRFSFAFIRVF